MDNTGGTGEFGRKCFNLLKNLKTPRTVQSIQMDYITVDSIRVPRSLMNKVNKYVICVTGRYGPLGEMGTIKSLHNTAEYRKVNCMKLGIHSWKQLKILRHMFVGN